MARLREFVFAASVLLSESTDSESSDDDCILNELLNSSDDFILNELLNSSSESDSSVDSYTPKIKQQRLTDFVDLISQYDKDEFKQQFRLQKSTCDFLIEQIDLDKIMLLQAFGIEEISSQTAVYMTLWYLTNTETIEEIADKFDVTESSAQRIISKIIDYLVKQSAKYIKWPNDSEKEKIRNVFYKKQNMSGVIGVIGGCHIRIKRSKIDDDHSDYSKSGYYTILLQGVCDSQKKFIDLFYAETGSTDDAQLLKKSSLYEKGVNGKFGNDFLIGDSTYPCLNWLIPLFKDNGRLTAQQKMFNQRHSYLRIVIDDAFNLLKGRFRRLKLFEKENIDFIVKCVFAAAVLHNICIEFNDELELINEENENIDEEVNGIVDDMSSQFDKRNEIFCSMFNLEGQ